jgi:HSP20 family protein
MALTRWEDVRTWNPFRELEEMSRRFGMLRGDGGSEILRLADWSPSVNVKETDSAYEIEAELPQVARDDIHVKVENGVLCIEGERKHRKEEKGEKFHRIESSYGKFMRRFTLPEDADAAKVDATSKDGMLTVKIPRTAAKKTEAKSIPVR